MVFSSAQTPRWQSAVTSAGMLGCGTLWHQTFHVGPDRLWFAGRGWAAQQMALITAFRWMAAGQMERQLLCTVVWAVTPSDGQSRWKEIWERRVVEFFFKSTATKLLRVDPQHHKIGGIEARLSVSTNIIKQTPPLYTAAVIRLNYVPLWKWNTATCLQCQNSLALVKRLLSKLFLLSDAETKFIKPLLSFQRLFLKQNEHEYLCGKINAETLSYWHQ